MATTNCAGTRKEQTNEALFRCVTMCLIYEARWLMPYANYNVFMRISTPTNLYNSSTCSLTWR
jgi:hypothetical protein